MGMQTWILPAIYQPVDYIWGDGRQRIVTDVLPKETDVWEVDCQLFDVSVNTGIFGSASGTVIFDCIGTNTNFNGFFTQIGSGNNYQMSSVSKDTERHTHIVNLNTRKYIIDGVNETDLSSLQYSKPNSTYGLWFYNGASGSTYIRYTSGRIYHCSIRGRMDLQPCIRTSDGKPGMYDLTSRTFYVNAGTGEFHVDDFVDCMDLDSCWIATSSSHRAKTVENSEAEITKIGGIITLTRQLDRYGLDMFLGYFESGKTYRISGTFGNIDGNAYIAKVNGKMLDAEFDSTRKATTRFSNGSVSFTPSESGLYELLVWNSGIQPITAENVSVTEA